MLKAIVLLTVVIAVSAEYFYRRDYTYVQDFDAFYKIHLTDNGSSYNDVFMTCYNEGSQLFYPKEKGEWVIVKTLLSSKKTVNTTDIIVGIYNEFGQGEFITADGQPTPLPLNDEEVTQNGDCVIMNLSGELRTEACVTEPPTKRLFVCKKIDEKPCPTIDLGYKYVHETRKCYKVNNRKTMWQDAWHTCYMEGGLLVSIESDVEANIVSRWLTDDTFEPYYAGFRRYPGRGSDFYTVKGKKLSDMGYYIHSNSVERDFNQDCGVIYGTGTLYLSSRKCENAFSFVCEIKAKY